MRYYLSGPMTGLPEFNYPEFNFVAQFMRSNNFEVVNPAENFDGDTDLPRSDYMRRDIEELLECDAIVLLDGWEASRGARLELQVAREIGLEVWRFTLQGLEPFEDVLPHEEALHIVHGSRGEDYGHPLDDFTKTASIWSAILGAPVTAEQVALCMVGVKLSREVNRPKRDNLVDAHGYLLTYDMVRSERARRDPQGTIDTDNI